MSKKKCTCTAPYLGAQPIGEAILCETCGGVVEPSRASLPLIDDFCKKQVFGFLQKLEEVIPPPTGCHHSITCSKYGSDETGWEQRLAVNVWKERPDGKSCHTFWIEDGDFDDVSLMVNAIEEALNG